MQHEKFMLQALKIAKLGKGYVEPNPMVGAVIVRDDKIIAAGYHVRYGQLHAERNAIADAARRQVDIAGADMYVTLEPCSHFGKTPPCTDAILKAKIARVFVAMEDPDEKVAGRGIEILKQAGVEVQVGICEEQAKKMLASYIKNRTKKRPWVICKWAQTSDGYLALGKGADRWISCETSRKQVHEIRSYCDGILAGIGTVLADNPMLNNRLGKGRQPVRIVLDSQLRIPIHCKLVESARDYKLLVVTSFHSLNDRTEIAQALEKSGAEVLPVSTVAGKLNLTELLVELGKQGFTNLLVEGGAQVLKSFISKNLADELVVFQSPVSLKSAGGNLKETLPRFDISTAVDMINPEEFYSPEVTESGCDKLTRIIRKI